MSDFQVYNERGDPAPPIPEHLYSIMPEQNRALFDFTHYDYERELLFLSSLVTLGSTAKHARLLWNTKQHSPCLFLCACGISGTGKSAMLMPKEMLAPMVKERRREYADRMKQYDKDLRKYEKENADDREGESREPEQPRHDLLTIPSNITAAALFEILDNAQECAGLYINDEASTLINALASKYGQFTDFLCKSFDQTDYEFARKTGGRNDGARNYILEKPRIAVVIAGTPGTLKPFFEANYENGVMSRFLHYRLPVIREHLCAVTNNDLGAFIRERASVELRTFIEWVDKPCLIKMPKPLQSYIDAEFTTYKGNMMDELGDAFGGLSNRLAVMAARISSIFGLLRLFKSNQFGPSGEFGLPDTVVLDEQDIGNAVELLHVLKWYTEDAYASYVSKSKHVDGGETPSKIMKILLQLEDEFDRSEWVEAAEMVGYKQRAADNKLKQLATAGQLVKKVRYGVYSKILT